MNSTMTPEELEGRLVAQRRVIQWLLDCTVRDPQALTELDRHLSATDPIQDHQEDPGAVPTPAFAVEAAATAELRLILGPTRTRLGGDEGA